MDGGQGEIETLQRACRAALNQLGPRGSFRLRALLGMLLHEVELEIERLRKRERSRD